MPCLRLPVKARDLISSRCRNGLKFKRILLIATCLLLGCWGCTPAFCADIATVREVTDGDTLRVSFQGKSERLRLIGIDTPENKPNERALKFSRKNNQDLEIIIALGKKAAGFVRQILPADTALRLEFDVEKRDRFGRLLAYAYLPDGRMLNEVIISSGFAYPLSVPPNVRYSARFRSGFDDARRARRGLWKQGAANFS